MRIFKMTSEEYHHYREHYDGACCSCGEFTIGGIKPDAEQYDCESCEDDQVFGIEHLLVSGRIVFEEDL